jgi:uncharacterized membrane protein
MSTKFTEKHPRTIAKMISWRVLLTISHIVNGFLATGSILVGLKIAGWATVINSTLYWLHERAWNFFGAMRKADPEKVFEEQEVRTVSKMISWRVVITASNFFIPFLVTGSWGSAVIFAGLATAVNMMLFYAHERVWNSVPWAKAVAELVDPSLKTAK